jgi:hypothetical protein
MVKLYTNYDIKYILDLPYFSKATLSTILGKEEESFVKIKIFQIIISY